MLLYQGTTSVVPSPLLLGRGFSPCGSSHPSASQMQRPTNIPEIATMRAFVSGHDFSRAVTALLRKGALAPAPLLFGASQNTTQKPLPAAPTPPSPDFAQCTADAARNYPGPRPAPPKTPAAKPLRHNPTPSSPDTKNLP